MAKFFNKFPRTLYALGDSPSVDVVTNLTVRYALEKSLKENTAAYYKHFITDGETPEILAHKFYGSAETHWIILLMNDIIDPQYDWPMSYDTLNRFIINKYSSPEYADTANTNVSGLTWANANDKEYYKVQRTVNSRGEVQDVSVTIDEDTYDSFNTINPYNITLADGSVITRQYFKNAKTYYEYETEENEKRRDIILLKNEFITDLEVQLEEFLNV
jgi:hypothetical protein